jgi:phenylpropionate dioxygenase-like ring-hydroxylating dioxygenase large terminal subunit
MPIMSPARLDSSGTQRALAQANHAPGAIYTSHEIFRREAEVYFKRDWLYVGRIEELAEPGDFMTLRIVGEPVVVSRDKKGVLHANYNMCAHRGVEVAYGSGNTRSFKCPYHGWVYGLDGQLTGAAYMSDSEGFDIKNCRLKALQLEVWRGNIFISFNPQVVPLEKAVAGFEKDFSHLGWEHCRLGNRIELTLNCNWKFIHENLLDFYHVGVLHAKTLGPTFSWKNEDWRFRSDGGLSIFFNSGPQTPGNEPLLGKMPWLEDEPLSYACTGFMAPNFQVFARIDCIRPIISWPIDESHTQVIIYHLFPESFFERTDIEAKLKIYKDYHVSVLEEDRTMLESMQKAMSSPAYKPGRLSNLEIGIHHFLNGYLDRVIVSDRLNTIGPARDPSSD